MSPGKSSIQHQDGFNPLRVIYEPNSDAPPSQQPNQPLVTSERPPDHMFTSGVPTPQTLAQEVQTPHQQATTPQPQIHDFPPKESHTGSEEEKPIPSSNPLPISSVEVISGTGRGVGSSRFISTLQRFIQMDDSNNLEILMTQVHFIHVAFLVLLRIG